MNRLSAFPITFKVEGKRILILGGGEEALAKARLAVKTSADVRVFAIDGEADFSGLEVTLERRPPVESDLENTALVFLTGESGASINLAKWARQRGIPVNTVDKPDQCDFYTPAIVDRAPLTIAISSEGEAPVLARQLRARIEALLSPEIGRLAALAGGMRERVEAFFSKGDDRRKYYERLMASQAVQTAIADGRGDEEAEKLLSGEVDEPGYVWLIGAGPGAEDLLTLRAQRILQEVDVIVHDQLVPELVVQMGRRDAERFEVGKSKGHHSFTQAQINALIIRLANQGKKVARLKSGDPMIFGRAGEEIAALREAGLGYAIVPGVTSALAAAADSATPVTLRKVSSGFVVATAHGAENTELHHWAALAAEGITLGLYMGKTVAAEVATRLIEAGLPATTPAGIVTNAGRQSRALNKGTVGDLAAGQPDLVRGPSIILIGEAVEYGDWTQAAEITSKAVGSEVA